MVSTKPMRSTIACDSCRNSKLKCVNNNDNTRCHRCNLQGLECVYTLKKSQFKKKRLRRYVTNLKPVPEIAESRPLHNVILPDKQTIIEVAELYFDNQYKGIFPIIHRPYFLSFLRSDDFDPATYMTLYYTKYFEANYAIFLKYPDPVVLLAVLALCARLHPSLPKFYGEFSECNSPETFVPNFSNKNYKEFDNKDNNAASNASNYFGWHARKLLKDVFDSPTIQRVQALSILSSHEWGEGNASRSYLYLGIASRMALVLGMGSEEGLYDTEDELHLDETSKFVCIESKRRTMWAVYMMDRCNALGRERSSCIRLDQVSIKLPCEEKDYFLGKLHEESLTAAQAIQYIRNPLERHLLSNTSCFGFLIILFEIWSKIAKWAGDLGGTVERLPPWNTGSTYSILSNELDMFAASLPVHLQFTRFNFEAYIADGSAACFGYLHSLYFTCRIFLCREYLFFTSDSFPTKWFSQLNNQLLQSIDDLAYIRRTLMPLNQMVIAPFTGFQVFTTAATSLFFNAFPSKLLESKIDNAAQVGIKYKRLAEESIEQIVFWSRYWGLGRSWYDGCSKLREKFDLFSKSRPKAIQEDETIQHVLHDYGTGKISEVYNPEFVHSSKKNTSSLDLIINETETNSGMSPDMTSFHFEKIGFPLFDFTTSLEHSLLAEWG